MALRGGLCLVFLVGLIWVQIAVAKKPGCIAPKLLYLPKNRAQVAIGRDIKLFCQISRVSRGTSYKWFKDGQRLYRKNNDRIRVKRMRFLKIKKTSLKDNGKYMCMAKNPCGLVKATIKLFVKTPPTVSTTPSIPATKPHIQKIENMSAREGENASIVCKASSYWMPHFQFLRWFKPSSSAGVPRFEVINQTPGKVEILKLEKKTTISGVKLTLFNITKGNEGRYMCMAGNSIGYNLQDMYLKVIAKEERDRTKPSIPKIENVTAREGENASIVCKASSYSMPHFQFLRWFKPSSSADIPRLEVIKQTPGKVEILTLKYNSTLNGVKLTLFNVRKGNEGRYMCMAGNYIGYNVQHMYLKVIAKEAA